MAEVQEITDITTARNEFRVEEAGANRERQRRREEFARGLVIRMARGEAFLPDDFLFAATLGSTEDYLEEGATLDVLAAIRPGQVVGVTLGDSLSTLGITAEHPFKMEVSAGGDYQRDRKMHNRKLEAILHFDLVAHRPNIYTGSPPEVGVIERDPEQDRHQLPNTSPLAVAVLRAWGEPDVGSRAFYKPYQVVVGAGQVLDFVVNHSDEVVNAEKVEVLVDHLAARTVG